jgi:hypothetical protein
MDQTPGMGEDVTNNRTGSLVVKPRKATWGGKTLRETKVVARKAWGIDTNKSSYEWH